MLFDSNRYKKMLTQQLRELEADGVITRTVYAEVPLDHVKYIPLVDDMHTYLSLGGELRERYEEFLNNPLFGLNHLSHDDYLVSRTLLNADLHVTSYFRSFVQLGFHDVYGKEGAITSTERSGFDMQQAFAEGNFFLGEDENVTLRSGRQEIPLGSQRLVSFREGPNIRQSFDAVRAIYQSGQYNLTGFVSRPVKMNRIVSMTPPTIRNFSTVFMALRPSSVICTPIFIISI